MSSEIEQTFILHGSAVFEGDAEIRGTLEAKNKSTVFTFKWIPEVCKPFDVEKINYEEASVFFFLHHLKKIAYTRNENSPAVIRFSIQDVRNSTHFVFGEDEFETIDRMFQFLLSQNYVQHGIKSADSYVVIQEVSKTYLFPDNSLPIDTFYLLVSHKSVINKILSENPEKEQKPITKENLNSFFDSDGKMKDFASLKAQIFSNGLEEDARPYAYSYILGVCDPDLNKSENIEKIKKQEKDFERILGRWKSRIPEQERYYQKFYSVILKDIKRTVKTPDDAFKQILEDIVACYAIEFPDTGYSQGMCDLVVTLMEIFLKEVTSDKVKMFDDRLVSNVEAESFVFWAYYGLLSVVGHDKLFMNMKISTDFVPERVFAIVQANAPAEARWITHIDQESLIFLPSPLLLLFRRFLNQEDLHYLWDRLLANEDPVSYLRFVLAATIINNFPVILIKKDSNNEITGAYTESLSLIKVRELVRVTNSLLERTKNENMHTQWVFMKYPEKNPLPFYKPKYFSLVD